METSSTFVRCILEKMAQTELMQGRQIGQSLLFDDNSPRSLWWLGRPIRIKLISSDG